MEGKCHDEYLIWEVQIFSEKKFRSFERNLVMQISNLEKFQDSS